MDVVLRSVGVVSREWDEQHLALRSAAQLILEAPGGFSAAVAGAAFAFTDEWQRSTRALARDAEGFADRLRVVIADWLHTDEATGVDLLALAAFSQEVR